MMCEVLSLGLTFTYDSHCNVLYRISCRHCLKTIQLVGNSRILNEGVIERL